MLRCHLYQTLFQFKTKCFNFFYKVILIQWWILMFFFYIMEFHVSSGAVCTKAAAVTKEVLGRLKLVYLKHKWKCVVFKRLFKWKSTLFLSSPSWARGCPLRCRFAALVQPAVLAFQNELLWTCVIRGLFITFFSNLQGASTGLSLFWLQLV